MSDVEKPQEVVENTESELVQEEEITEVDGWKPSVSLDVKEVASGEELEEVVYSQRSKLYRWAKGEDGEPGAWKERGTGDCKLMKNKENGRVRMLMRQEKTGKIVANHFIVEKDNFCVLTPNAGSEKCWVWMCSDFAEEEVVVEQFALKFRDAEIAQGFKKAFETARDDNKKAFEVSEENKENEKEEKEE